MATGQALKRDSIIGAIVLAFSHSKLKDLVGTDALRSVLEGQYRDLVFKETLHLQVVWNLLHDQPGFDPELAQAPFALIKQWEKRLGLTVEMPESLASMSATQVMAAATHCPVPKAQRERTLAPEASRLRVQAVLDDSQSDSLSSKSDDAPTRKPGLEAALGVVALLGFAFGGYTLMGFLGGPDTESVSVSKLDTGLPLSKGEKLGRQLVAVVDDSWLGQDAEAMREGLETALRRLKGRDIDSLVLKDGSGAIRASVQWVGEPPVAEARTY